MLQSPHILLPEESPLAYITPEPLTAAASRKIWTTLEEIAEKRGLRAMLGWNGDDHRPAYLFTDRKFPQIKPITFTIREDCLRRLKYDLAINIVKVIDR